MNRPTHWRGHRVPPLVCLSLLVLLGAATAALGPTGCGTARRSPPVAGPLHLSEAQPEDEAELLGQQVFMNHCYQCHPGGRAGLGPALNDKPLPGFAIRTQVRQGFGTMPAFPEEMISDEKLDGLVAYLIALRRNEPQSPGDLSD